MRKGRRRRSLFVFSGSIECRAKAHVKLLFWKLKFPGNENFQEIKISRLYAQ
jgi:hypothetical protein